MSDIWDTFESIEDSLIEEESFVENQNLKNQLEIYEISKSGYIKIRNMSFL